METKFTLPMLLDIWDASRNWDEQASSVEDKYNNVIMSIMLNVNKIRWYNNVYFSIDSFCL